MDLSELFYDEDGDDTLVYDSFHSRILDVSIEGSIATITPRQEYNGLGAIQFSASDGITKVFSDWLKINVSSVNDAPTIIRSKPRLPVVNVKPGKTRLFMVDVTDVDEGDLDDLSVSWVVQSEEPVYNESLLIARDIDQYEPVKYISQHSSGEEGFMLYRAEYNNSVDVEFFADVMKFESVDQVDNYLIALLNDGFIETSDYKGNQLYNATAVPALVWQHGKFLIAVGSENEQIADLPEPLIDAYLMKYWPTTEEVNRKVFFYPYTVTLEENHTLTAYISDRHAGTDRRWDIHPTVRPVARNFTGNTTRFDEIPVEELDNVTNVVLDKPDAGMIDFGDEILNLTDSIDIDNFVAIKDDVVAIDTDELPGFKDKPATITLRGLTVERPIIYYDAGFKISADDISTPCDFCTLISYEDGVLVFTVEHFSSFAAGENPNNNSAPQIAVNYPKEKELITTEDGVINFSINATDLDEPTLEIKWYGNESDWLGDGESIAIDFPGAGVYEIKVIVEDSQHATANETWTVTASEVPITSEYTIPELNASTIDSVTEFTIEKVSKGKVEFGDTVLDLSDFVDVDSAVTIDTAKIGIEADEFENKPATLTMYNLGWDKTPFIHKDGELCPEDVCTFVSYNGDLVFNVTGFSLYEAIENKTVEPALEVVSSLLLGSSNQERNKTIYAEFDVKNIGTNQAITGINVSSTAESKYEVMFSLDNSNFASSVSLNLNALETKKVYVKGIIPITEESGMRSIGLIKLDASGTAYDKDITLKVSPLSVLSISDMRIIHNGDKDNVDHGDAVKDIRPGAELRVEVELKNNLDDVDLEDAFFTATIEGIDDGDDEDEDSDDFTIRPGRKKKDTVTFDIPLDADEDTYDLVIEAEADEEDSNAKHTVTATVYLEIERKSHEINIKKAELRQSALKCNRETFLDFRIKNTGSKDEDEIKYTIKNDELGLNVQKKDIELSSDYDDDDNEYSKSELITVPVDTKAGTYTIDINVYYDDTFIGDTKQLELTVEDCVKWQEVPTEKPKTTPEPSTITPDTTFQDIKPKPTVKKATFKDSDEYVMLLAIVAILILGAIIYLIGAIMILGRKRRRRRSFY